MRMRIVCTAPPEHWDMIERLERLTTLEENTVRKPNGCWLYRGSAKPEGYVPISLSHNGVREHWHVHRLVWVLRNGPIPDGLFVCHKCDVPNCISPDHLWLGTPLQNNQDKIDKGRVRVHKNAVRRASHG